MCYYDTHNLIVCQEDVGFLQEELKKFGQRLKDLRIKAGKTQQDMAGLLGCSTSNYQKMEYGQVNLPATSLMKLADYFGVTTDYLLGRE